MNVPPVLLILFRREDTTRQVFEAIRSARPAQLFLAADGPRSHRPDDAEACRRTREVVSVIDWPCEVRTRFLETNQGIKVGVASAITWFFEQVPEGIVLEDDCLPHPDFFSYAGELLERFRDDTRVFQISGTNFQIGARSPASYFYSRYNHVWGWASWARAWKAYDPELIQLSEFLQTAQTAGFWDSAKERVYWTKVFRATQSGTITTWDYQWKFTLWKQGALCVYPERNLVTNLGFGDGATNTADASITKGARPLESLGSLVHNPIIVRDRTADQFTFRRLYWGSTVERTAARLKKLLRLLRLTR